MMRKIRRVVLEADEIREETLFRGIKKAALGTRTAIIKKRF